MNNRKAAMINRRVGRMEKNQKKIRGEIAETRIEIRETRDFVCMIKKRILFKLGRIEIAYYSKEERRES